MRVLIVRQPWASLIATGRKSVELRSWSTSYRGPICILAGARPWHGPHDYELGPRGGIVGVVSLVDVRKATPDDVSRACLAPPANHFAWVLSDAMQVPFVRAKGRLGLYEDERLRSTIAALLSTSSAPRMYPDATAPA